jgi:hypothetical protein
VCASEVYISTDKAFVFGNTYTVPSPFLLVVKLHVTLLLSHAVPLRELFSGNVVLMDYFHVTGLGRGMWRLEWIPFRHEATRTGDCIQYWLQLFHLPLFFIVLVSLCIQNLYFTNQA